MTGESVRSLDVWRLRIEPRHQDGVLVLTISGRLGRASSGELQTELDRLIGEGERRMVVDLEKVDYVSSAGLLAFDATGSRLAASQGCLVLCHLSDAVRTAVELAGPASPFLIERDLQGAVRVASGLWVK
jgi:stage II sporulation protein AA (anti-sigma F factor antagonist)